ncbi:MAG: tRNA (adenosine(37)-N6)-dimethylallyltransferase MiaA [Candidatus Colwellbacteria bacterium]|nr:tRNA (adenosine(37)-N6)-dimethylallyltransferase MiaA [Candidatus Colwellbacteria bacterium]
MTKTPNNKTAPRPKVLAIVGPNASGKSDLAVQLAHKFNGEVISADSRQVYRGLDLSSGKVPGKWRIRGFNRRYEYQDIPHHLVDIVSPRKSFTVQQYKKKAQRALQDILQRGKLPIVAGGTGFYVDALLYDFQIPEAPPNKQLRKELEGLTTEQLMHRLSALDPHRAKSIDAKNRRRIIRAIEIVVSIHSPVPQIDLFNKESPYHLLKIGMDIPKDELKRKMAARLERRIKDGMIEEVRRTHLLGVSWERLRSMGLEFHHIIQHIKGEIPEEKMVTLIETKDHQFARKQMVWFKRDKNTIWIDVPAKASPLVQGFLAREV